MLRKHTHVGLLNNHEPQSPPDLSVQIRATIEVHGDQGCSIVKTGVQRRREHEVEARCASSILQFHHVVKSAGRNEAFKRPPHIPPKILQ